MPASDTTSRHLRVETGGVSGVFRFPGGALRGLLTLHFRNRSPEIRWLVHALGRRPARDRHPKRCSNACPRAGCDEFARSAHLAAHPLPLMRARPVVKAANSAEICAIAPLR